MDGPAPNRSPTEPPTDPTQGNTEDCCPKTEDMKDELVTLSTRKENCCDKFLTCLSHVPCASLIAWIILLLGLGGLTGSLLYGVTKCRKIMEDGTFWWFMEFTVIGVVVIMFVLGTLFLVIAHLSSDPTNRYVFNTSKKNMCARGLNIFVLFIAYFLAVIWVAGSSLAVMPLLVSTFILSTDFKKGDCIELKYYGLEKKVCDPELEVFLKEGKELFTCYIFTYVSSVLVTISMIHFLISISANYTHLKDSRFATYNAYDTEEVRNSKHSMLDTNM